MPAEEATPDDDVDEAPSSSTRADADAGPSARRRVVEARRRRRRRPLLVDGGRRRRRRGRAQGGPAPGPARSSRNRAPPAKWQQSSSRADVCGTRSRIQQIFFCAIPRFAETLGHARRAISRAPCNLVEISAGCFRHQSPVAAPEGRGRLRLERASRWRPGTSSSWRRALGVARANLARGRGGASPEDEARRFFVPTREDALAAVTWRTGSSSRVASPRARRSASPRSGGVSTRRGGDARARRRTSPGAARAHVAERGALDARGVPSRRGRRRAAPAVHDAGGPRWRATSSRRRRRAKRNRRVAAALERRSALVTEELPRVAGGGDGG